MKNMEIKKAEANGPRFEPVMKSEVDFRIFDNLFDDWVKVIKEINYYDNYSCSIERKPQSVILSYSSQEQAMMIADELNNKAKENV